MFLVKLDINFEEQQIIEAWLINIEEQYATGYAWVINFEEHAIKK